MAEKKIIYSIKINGIDQEIKNVQSLNSSIKNLGDSINEFDTGNITAGGENIENLNVTIGETTDKFDEAGQSVQNFDVNLDNIDPAPLNIVNKNLDSTTEKVDKLTFAGEKGFKGLSDALKLFGIDTSILDNVKEGLGAIGDLLDSQSKLGDVAFNSAPAAKQAETIQELAKAQTISNTATNAGTVATTASSTATKGATIATQAFNVALRALPFLAVIGAITTVIALYSQWKDSQKQTSDALKGNFSELEKGLDNIKNKYDDLNNSIENNGDFNQIEGQKVIDQINKEIELLEQKGATQDEIFQKRKQLITEEINQLNLLIKKNNDLIISNESRISDLEKSLSDFQKLDKDYVNLINNAKDVDTLNELSEERLKNQTKIKDIELEIKGINAENNKLNLNNLSIGNQISLIKDNDFKILAASNELEKEKLKIQKEQEKIKLSEELEKIGQQIEQNFQDLYKFNEEFFRLYNELEQSVNKDKLKIAIDSKDFNQAFDLLKKSLDNFTFEFENSTKDIEEKLRAPFEKALEKIQDNISNLELGIEAELKINDVPEKDINKVMNNLKDKIVFLQKDLEIKFMFGKKSNEIIIQQTDEIKKVLSEVGMSAEELKNNLEAFFSNNILFNKVTFKNIDDFNSKFKEVKEKISKGFELSKDDRFLISLDEYTKSLGIVDGVLDENINKFIEYKISVRESIEKVRESLNQDFKLGKIDQKALNDINGYINEILVQTTSIGDLKDKINNLTSAGLSSDALVTSSAQLKVFGEKIKEASDLLKNAEGNFGESLGNIQNIVEGNLKGLQDKFDNGGNLNFKLFLNQDLRKQLKATLSEPVQVVIDDLNKKKDELKTIFEGIIQNNPEAGEALKQQLQQLLNQIDAAIAKLNGKVKENNSKVDSTFKEFTKKYGDTIKDTVQAAADLYTAINDLQIQALENQQKEIDDFYDNQAQTYETEIERIQQFYDLQSQIASDSLSKINDFENQLQTARGARAEFLLKLIAAEQAKNQLAEKQKADALKREEKLKKDAAKAEEERAAKQEQIERRKFQLQKASNIAQIIVNGALAVVQALSSPPGPPATIPLAVIVGALSAVQLAVAASAKFAKGGVFDLGGELTGKSHAEGGMSVMNEKGQKVAEVEGGEYIINKKSTQNPSNKAILDKINLDPNFFNNKIVIDKFGKNNKFELGGVYDTIKQANSRTPDFGQIINTIQVAKQVTNNPNIASNNNLTASVDTGAITNAIVEGMGQVTIQASILDIINQNNKQIEIDTLRRI